MIKRLYRIRCCLLGVGQPRSIVAAAGMILALAISAFSTDCTLNFGENRTTFNSGLGPRSIAVGDFNRDGLNDMAISDYGSATGAPNGGVWIALNSGGGAFAPSRIAVGINPRSTIAVDVNQDGYLDLAVLNYVSGACCISTYVTVLLGDGFGNFGLVSQTFIGPDANSLVAGDFNKDGKLDLATTILTSPFSSVAVVLGDGAGGFGPPTNFTAQAPARVLAAGDLNRDGNLDLVSANLNGFTVSVLLGQGNGSFGSPAKFYLGANPKFLALADFNLDSKLDVVTANTVNSVSVLLGSGNGAFGSPTAFSTASAPETVAVADLDGDGFLDLATSNSGTNNVSVLRGNGTGTFSLLGNYAAGTNPRFVAADDFNGDRKIDLAVTNTDFGDISVLFGEGNGAGCDVSMQFSSPTYSVDESTGSAAITVTRSDASFPATVKYATSDTTDVNFICNPFTSGQPTGAASRKCDYHIAAGRLRFAAGESSKQINLSIVNDVYAEGPESLTISLSSPTGAILGSSHTTTVTITDDDTSSQPNPIDGTPFYVRMLYVDLLSREPDPGGFAGWVHRIDVCGQPGEPPPPCDRVTVGGDGFLRSAEFFDREFFVIRLYRTALGRIPRFDDLGDLAFVSGFLTGGDLEQNKQELVTDIMSRSEFSNIYSGLSNAQYVDTLIQTSGVPLPGVREIWVDQLDSAITSRATVFREISERPEISAKYLHEAQVVSCYYGFFTRNPDGAYFNYLQRLNSGEINLGDLANAFINAAEYRQRFGP